MPGQDSTGFTPFELLYGRSVRTPMTILKELWTGEVEDQENVSTYQYVIDLRERIEETCALAKEQLAEIQKKNQKYYNRRARNSELQQGDLVLLLLATERNKLTYRTCVNFKELNKITVFDPEPMMSADDIFPKLAGSRYYSTFDFCKGYWQIPTEENSAQHL